MHPALCGYLCCWRQCHLALFDMELQSAGLGAPAGAGPARGAAGVVVPAVCGACAVVGGLGVLGGRGGGIGLGLGLGGLGWGVASIGLLWEVGVGAGFSEVLMLISVVVLWWMRWSI